MHVWGHMVRHGEAAVKTGRDRHTAWLQHGTPTCSCGALSLHDSSLKLSRPCSTPLTPHTPVLLPPLLLPPPLLLLQPPSAAAAAPGPISSATAGATAAAAAASGTAAARSAGCEVTSMLRSSRCVRPGGRSRRSRGTGWGGPPNGSAFTDKLRTHNSSSSSSSSSSSETQWRGGAPRDTPAR
jgi:hypothetical protein